MEYKLKTNDIVNLIYVVRGQQVMLDCDLARLYHCKNGTKSLNLAVKRNIERFPNDFCFQLTKEEYDNLKFQFETSSSNNTYGGVRKLPYVYTEEGVSQLSSVLHTDVAAKISVTIMRAFVFLRHYVEEDLLDQKYYNNLTLKNNLEIKELSEKFNTFKEEKEINELYFDGKIYDAYSKILDIFKEANKKLIIIDRYLDKTILDIISKISCSVFLITSKKCKLSDLDIKKYNSTYYNLEICFDDSFHDRYFIIDDTKIYHSGNSINHIGYRKSSIDVLSDDSIKNKIVYDAYNIINNNDSSNKKITNKEIKKNRVNLEERFADYKEENLSKEFAWDDPVGKEIL
jgi:hypothetical protein